MLRRGQGAPVQPDPLEPLLPRLGEAVPGLGAVPDDRQAPGWAADEQHLPLRVGQLLGLVDDDVRERPGEQVKVGARRCVLLDQCVLQVLVPQHRHQAHAVVVAPRLDQVVEDPGPLLALDGDGGFVAMPAS